MVESMNTLAKISCADVDIRSRILTFRGVQVMLDRDLAELYGVDVKRLNQQVNRNLDRFPERFMHQLTMQEFADLKLQIATSSSVGDGMDVVLDESDRGCGTCNANRSCNSPARQGREK